mmetsp:Transcript_118252/g.339256  ORF Transcript_118252/g.339256 Transcript_118252/m.339256 type:complete len:649 (-) Transcript_118252:55-2001(-)
MADQTASNVPQSPAITASGRSVATGSRAPKVRLVECGPLGGSGAPRIGGAAMHHLDWAMTPGGQRIRVLSSTAQHLPNRERDKQRVERTLGLPEFGDSSTEFYAAGSGFLPVALGYERIVYGDHGPYVEFAAHQICWSTFPNIIERPAGCFFDEMWTADGMTMLYAQKRHVTNKPNPPSGPWSASNNRPEGYANYVVGRYYIACEVGTIAVRFGNVSGASAARRRRRQQQLQQRGVGGKGGEEVDGFDGSADGGKGGPYNNGIWGGEELGAEGDIQGAHNHPGGAAGATHAGGDRGSRIVGKLDARTAEGEVAVVGGGMHGIAGSSSAVTSLPEEPSPSGSVDAEEPQETEDEQQDGLGWQHEPEQAPEFQEPQQSRGPQNPPECAEVDNAVTSDAVDDCRDGDDWDSDRGWWEYGVSWADDAWWGGEEWWRGWAEWREDSWWNESQWGGPTWKRKDRRASDRDGCGERTGGENSTAGEADEARDACGSEIEAEGEAVAQDREDASRNEDHELLDGSHPFDESSWHDWAGEESWWEESGDWWSERPSEWWRWSAAYDSWLTRRPRGRRRGGVGRSRACLDVDYTGVAAGEEWWGAPAATPQPRWARKVKPEQTREGGEEGLPPRFNVAEAGSAGVEGGGSDAAPTESM